MYKRLYYIEFQMISAQQKYVISINNDKDKDKNGSFLVVNNYLISLD